MSIDRAVLTFVSPLIIPEEFRHMTQIQGRVSVDGLRAVIHLQEDSHAHTIWVAPTGHRILDTCDNEVSDHSAFCSTVETYWSAVSRLNVRVPQVDPLTLAVRHLALECGWYLPPYLDGMIEFHGELDRLLLESSQIESIHFGFGLDSAQEDWVDGEWMEDLDWRTYPVDEDGNCLTPAEMGIEEL